MLSHMSSGYKAHGFLGANLWETREHSTLWMKKMRLQKVCYFPEVILLLLPLLLLLLLVIAELKQYWWWWWEYLFNTYAMPGTFKVLYSMNAFHVHNNLMIYVLSSWSLFYRWGNKAELTLSSLPKVSELVSNRATFEHWQSGSASRVLKCHTISFFSIRNVRMEGWPHSDSFHYSTLCHL